MVDNAGATDDVLPSETVEVDFGCEHRGKKPNRGFCLHAQQNLGFGANAITDKAARTSFSVALRILSTSSWGATLSCTELLPTRGGALSRDREVCRDSANRNWKYGQQPSGVTHFSTAISTGPFSTSRYDYASERAEKILAGPRYICSNRTFSGT